MQGEVSAVKAKPGDRIVVEGTHVGESRREGEIVEVRGPDGTPPYLVRWSSAEEPTLVFPGPDAHIAHAAEASQGQ